MSKWSGLRIFGLLTLLSLALVAGLGWIVVRGRDRDFESLKARVQESGGHVSRVTKSGEWMVKFRRWVGSDIMDGIAGFDGHSIWIENPDATKEQLTSLLSARPIRSINAARAKNVDDAWVAAIRDPLAIKKLGLGETSVTDRSVDAVLEMKDLEEIDLFGTVISDEAVNRLRVLPKLRDVQIEGPNIRSVQLVDLTFVDAGGNPASHSEAKLWAIGRLKIEGLSGAPRYLGIEVIQEGSGESADSDLSSVVEESPGIWKFRVEMTKVPSGKSLVAIFFFYRTPRLPTNLPADPGVTLIYRLKAADLNLMPLLSDDETISSGTR
jgi:hypothetical protein